MSKPAYSLKQISKWAEAKNKFELPNVQRGFVWKPGQIEDVWDSILRGYPIGCFVIGTLIKDGIKSFQILDGQQRATAIALGFAAKTFRGSEHNYKLFIDLGFAKADSDHKQFLFRIITKSHPWGYNKSDNSKTLDSISIRKALEEYAVENHLDKPLDGFFPYDAKLPIPFSFFVHAKTATEVFNEVKKWKLFPKIKDHYRKQNDNSISGFEQYLKVQIRDFHKKVAEVLKKEHLIPASYYELPETNESQEDHDYPKHRKNLSSGTLNEMMSDEIENLFVRLNSSGTPLRGEELNYSILKAHISPSLQKRIEKACEHFIKPSKFISILFRIYTNDNENPSGNISLKIKAKVFQKSIAEKKAGFQRYISQVLTNKDYDGKKLLEYAKDILAYHPKNNENGFPFIVYTGITEYAPEIIFSLFYRIKIKGDRFELQSDLHHKMLGTISLFYWIGKGERIRDYTKLQRNIWPAVSEIDEVVDFWTKDTIRRAQLDDVMYTFPKLKGQNGLKYKFTRIANSSSKYAFSFSDEDSGFMDSTLYNWDLVAYVQRMFLYHQFKPEHYGLEDTNIPFDWDHISPQSAINIKNAAKQIKDAYQTAGNLRAWPFGLNREDQAKTPSLKFNPLSGNPKADLTKNLKYYSEILKEEITTVEKLKKVLLEKSSCKPGWLKCNSEKLRSTNEWKPVFKQIMLRNIDLCNEWYENLHIDSLRPDNTKVDFVSLFYSKKWNKNSGLNQNKILKEYLNYREHDYWYCSLNKNLNLYLGYKHSEELMTNSFYFGIVENTIYGKLSSIKIKDDDSDYKTSNYEDKIYDIYGSFTLISATENSYIILLKKILDWTKNFPDKALAKEITLYIKNSLKNRIKEQV